nr:hypothetical protein GCM10020063_049270 [Dactylosporangium thailandense]
MIGWLDGVWTSARLVQIVEGGEADGPQPGRAVLAELREPPALGALRALSTTGRFTGDICRCHGHTTVVLRGTAGEALASASLHAYGSVSWERPRFRNDLEVDDAAGLHLLLAEHGVRGQVQRFLSPLMDLLRRHETGRRPQFRPAGKAGRRYLAERRVPVELHATLGRLTGQQAGELAEPQILGLGRLLAAATPSPAERAAALLSWLGRLTVPAEAYWAKAHWCGSCSPTSPRRTSRPPRRRCGPAPSRWAWSTCS